MANRRTLTVAVSVLRRQIARLEKRVAKLEGHRKRIGFQATPVIGDREEQDPDDPEIPDEVP